MVEISRWTVAVPIVMAPFVLQHTLLSALMTLATVVWLYRASTPPPLTPLGTKSEDGAAAAMLVPAGRQLLFVAAQLGTDSEGVLAPRVHDQCSQALENVRGVLATADLDWRDLVKLTVYVASPKYASEFQLARESIIGHASSAVRAPFEFEALQGCSPSWSFSQMYAHVFFVLPP